MFSFPDNLDRVFIIAEAGVNHNGDIINALNLIDAAVDAGADAVKFQTFKTKKLVVRTAEKAQYQKKNTKSEDSQYDMLRKLELSYEDHFRLLEHCNKKGIMFLSTPFDFDSVDLLEKLNIKVYKVSSGDLTNMPLIKYIASKNKPLILSTGMATMGEVEEAVSWVKEKSNSRIFLLHCTTEYPAPFDEVNLKAIETLRNSFKLDTGYSDHTPGIEIPIAAVAMGTRIIEKHFTLDKNMEGPDHKASLDPDELKLMVRCIRNVEKAIGDGIKKPTGEEKKNIEIARKSIVARNFLKAGQKIREEDIDIKRPQKGILPRFVNDIIGTEAKRDIEIDEIITWDDIV